MQLAESLHGNGDQHHRGAEQQEARGIEAGAFSAAQVGDELPDGVAAQQADRQG